MSGWDDLDGSTPPVEPDQRQIDMNVLMARTFGTEDGEKVLAWMRQFYLEQPCWRPGEDSSFGMFREGQNTVIRDIEQRIARAKNRTDTR